VGFVLLVGWGGDGSSTHRAVRQPCEGTVK
jgi:hypothetical protein